MTVVTTNHRGRKPVEITPDRARALARVRSAVAAVERSHGVRDRRILDAVALGVPMHVVAEAAGVDMSTVQRLRRRNREENP